MEVQDDPYQILGVDRSASDHELRRARNRLLLHWHPDRTQDPQAAEQASRINAAYEVLSDPDLRSAYDRGTPNVSLASILSRPRRVQWSPPASDEVTAAAQQRVVDKFKDGSRPALRAPRRWSDTVARPASSSELRVRLLGRGLPFAILAVASLIALPWLRSLPPLLVPAVPYLPIFAGAAALRGLAGRATRFGNEGWGRFTASWVVGVAAIVAAYRWVLPLAPASIPHWLQPLLPPALLILAALLVYRITRAVRLPG